MAVGGRARVPQIRGVDKRVCGMVRGAASLLWMMNANCAVEMG